MEATTSQENHTEPHGINLDYEIHVPLFPRAILCVVILLSLAVGIIGNVFTCFIVYRKKRMRSAINILLTNIACVDLISACTVMPFIVCELLDAGISVFGACVCLSVLKDTCVCVASYTLLVISVDRYLIIVLRKDRLCPKVARFMIAIIWGCSVFLSAPQFFSFIDFEFITSDMILCYNRKPHTLSAYVSGYIRVLMSVTVYVPVGIMFYMYSAILRTVQLSSKRIHNHSDSAVSVSVTQYNSKLGLPIVAVPFRFTGDFKEKRKAFGTILLLYMTSLCCWLPYTTYKVITIGSSGQILTETILLSLGFLKGTLYPIIFCARNDKFRLACLLFLPTSIRIPKTACMERKQRRVDPKTLYQCSEIETRI